MTCFPDHQHLIESGKARVKGVARRHPWKTWDPRILDIHLKSVVEGREILSPKCSTAHESILYTNEPHVLASQEFYNGKTEELLDRDLSLLFIRRSAMTIWSVRGKSS
ncbi:hypothetical protein B0H19DRAFT_1176501, partial [Mycena capillaripes]